MQVTHKKTGEIYYVEDVVIDTTNELEFEPKKQVKILYANREAQKFVREAKEFFEKFDIPSGFNILTRACESTLRNIEKTQNISDIDFSSPCTSVDNSIEYKGELIDIDSYRTIGQMVDGPWYVPLSVVKSLAYTQLCDVFNIRCSDFEIAKKKYDNATNDYFLIGYKQKDFPKFPAQICKIPKEVFYKLYNYIEAEEEEDDDYN